MKGHHLILGELEDFITGSTLEDTHDERYRQALARLLVEEKGYMKKDIIPICELIVNAGKNKGIIKLDFKIILSGKTAMIIKYGPGSLITRHRPSLAMSRLAESYQIPVAVVTNGEDADILNGEDGSIISSGIKNIPSKDELMKIASQADFKPVSEKRAEMESRIVYCYEIEGACPCDTNICRM